MKGVYREPDSKRERERERPRRDRTVDLLKTLAILGVIIIHTATGGYGHPIGSLHWTSAILWGSIVRASVPIFFMCSGALFLDPMRELPLKKLYLRNILRILVAMFVWAMLYKVYGLLVSDTFSLASLWQAAKEVILFKQEFHLYYLHIILLFYALVPIVRVFAAHASRTELRYALALWFIVGIVYPTVRPFYPFTLLSGIPLQWHLNMTYASIGYGLLGFYLKKYGISLKLSVASALLGFAFAFGGTVLMSLKNGALYSNFLEGMSFGVALLAAGIYGVCTHAHLPERLGRAVTYLSKASFCIYLVHIFVINLFNRFGIGAAMFAPALSIPLVALANLAISLAVYFILSKLPLVKRWLI